MSNNYQELSIKTTSQVSNLLSDFLMENGSDGVVIDKGEEDTVSYYIVLKAYYPENFNIDNLITDLTDFIDLHSKFDLDFGSKKTSINIIKENDWENNWKQYFDVFKVGKNLVIKPLWCEYEKKGNEIVINFDPGSFFGSTPHPSTRLCLEEIEDFSSTIKNKENYNILDLGSGSGILSLALYYLGFKRITAIDIDPVAIRSSEDNFSINNMSSVKLFLGEIKDCYETYDFIAGNLLAEIIEELAEQISNKLNKGGVFICAGITREKEDVVEKALKMVNIKIEKKRYHEEWVLIKAIKN